MVKSSRCEPPSATPGMWGGEGRDPLNLGALNELDWKTWMSCSQIKW